MMESLNVHSIFSLITTIHKYLVSVDYHRLCAVSSARERELHARAGEFCVSHLCPAWWHPRGIVVKYVGNKLINGKVFIQCTS